MEYNLLDVLGVDRIASIGVTPASSGKVGMIWSQLTMQIIVNNVEEPLLSILLWAIDFILFLFADIKEEEDYWPYVSKTLRSFLGMPHYL